MAASQRSDFSEERGKRRRVMSKAVGILFPTFHRTEYALRTIKAAVELLKYEKLAWYVADAGSHQDHHTAVLQALDGQKLLGRHYKALDPGPNWNLGIGEIFKETEIYLRLEDDFELRTELDITPYVELLNEIPEIGQVRMGLMPVGLDMQSMGHNGRIYMRILKNRQYCYSGHPCLIHKRFHDFYGMFHPTFGPGDCEVDFDSRVRAAPDGPEIWWPLEMGTWGPWAHIGEVKSYDTRQS